MITILPLDIHLSVEGKYILLVWIAVAFDKKVMLESYIRDKAISSIFLYAKAEYREYKREDYYLWNNFVII